MVLVSWGRRLLFSLITALAVFTLPLISDAFANDLIFGPQTCQRGTGAPTVFNYSFAAADPSRGFIFKIYNGGLEDNTYDLVSSSTITLNGTEILGPSNFNQNVIYLEVPVTLQAQNSLSVEVRGKPGGAMILKIYPLVVIDSPTEAQVVGSQPITATGHLNAQVTSVTVSGVPAQISGTTFSAGGIPLVEGINNIVATATRDDGSTGTDKIHVTLDSTAPVVTITYPLEGLVTNRDVMPLYEVSDALDPHPAVSVNPLPPYSSEGAYQMTVTATDWAGNMATAPLSFVIDKTPPAVELTIPAEGLVTNKAVVAAYTVTDSQDPYPSVVLLPSDSIATEGAHQVILAATDWAGNHMRLTRSFLIDLTAPVISAMAPAPETATADALPVVSAGFADALSGIDATSVQLLLDGADVSAGATVTTRGMSYSPAMSLSDGTHHVSLTVRDAAGNGATMSWNFTIDTTPPVITVTSPADGSTITTATVDVVGSVDDHGATITINGGAAGLVEGAFTLSGVPLQVGLNAILVEAVDALGNTYSLTVNVTYMLPAPTVTLMADPVSIAMGGNATLTWTSTDALEVTIDQGVGVVATAGSRTVSPMETTIYTATATGPGGTGTGTVTVVVDQPGDTVTITASPATIRLGESTVLSWNGGDASSALISHGIGLVESSGTQVVRPTVTTEYVIVTGGAGGAIRASVVVNVLGSVQSQPQGSFGSRYHDLVPEDATIQSYDPRRFSVLTGKVKGTSTLPIGEVRVSIHEHPEYGTALSDNEGRFSLPVEGGGTLTVDYRKEGFLRVHRQVDIPWNDVVVVEEVTLVSEDASATRVVFDGNPSSIVVHRSTTLSDVSGARDATLVFTGDNMAYARTQDGELPLSSISVRATEYESPASMPAKLPASSAYTYCTELRVDAAESVRFAKPITMYVTNFLGFDVGTIVPVGYYDFQEGIWIPSDNGVVVALLDANGDGEVDALDSDGDNAPNDLDGDGNYANEVQGLTIASGYAVGSTFWRVKTSHFSPYDLNWPYGPPEGAVAPILEAIIEVLQQLTDEEPNELSCPASYVENRSRVFHEEIRIPGSEILLHYSSNRVPGYKTVISVPASGPTVPDVLEGIMVKVDIAGVRYEYDLSPSPNQSIRIVWDGKDYLGRQLTGLVKGHVKVGYVYGVEYKRPSEDLLTAFAEPGYERTDIRGRDVVVSWMKSEIDIYAGGGAGILGRGWTLSPYHQGANITQHFLLKGDGAIHKQSSKVVTTIAGTGVVGFGGEGVAARESPVAWPTDVVADPAGNVYVAESWNHRVRRIDTEGIITTVAGTGIPGYSGDGAQAASAQLAGPWGLALDKNGNLYVSDSLNNCIRRIDPSGIITTVAGSGPFYAGQWTPAGFSGDNGAAVLARISYPLGIAVDGQGNLFVAEYYNNRVRKVNALGVVTTVAGNGVGDPLHPGYGTYSGDGGPAAAAGLNSPYDVAVDEEGQLYIADTQNHRIRLVSSEGIITTVAGNGDHLPSPWYLGTFTGDGGPAIAAGLNRPSGVFVMANGELLIADINNWRVRKLDRSGMINTVAGTTNFRHNGDLPPLEAHIAPRAVCETVGGHILIADYSNHRIREVVLSGGSGGTTYEESLAHRFREDGKLAETYEFPSGRLKWSFSYDTAAQLVGLSDVWGNTLIIERDGAGRPEAVTPPNGLRTALVVDEEGDLKQVRYPDGTYYSFDYASGGLLRTMRDPNGNLFQHEYDEEGRLAYVADPEGGSWLYNQSMDETRAVTTTVVTGEFNTTAYIDRHLTNGSLVSESTGSDGSGVTSTLSADRFLSSTSLSCGLVQSLKYGVDKVYGYRHVKAATMVLPSGITRSSSYGKTYQDTNNDLAPDLSIETATTNGKMMTRTSDYLAGVETLKTPMGRTVSYIYDPMMREVERVSIPGLLEASFDRDAYGNFTAATVGERITSLTYDVNRNPDVLTLPDGGTVDYDFDVMGRLRSERRADGGLLQYEYDANGNVSVLVGANEVGFQFAYSANNLRRNFIQPLSGTYQYSYDRDRRLKSVVAPSGKAIFNSYSQGNLASISTPESTTYYDFQCGGRLGSATRDGEGLSFSYDGPLVQGEGHTGTLTASIGYTYNNDFAVTSMSYAGGTDTLSYDADGLLTQAGNLTVTRDPQNGLPLEITGGGLKASRTFSGYSELDGQSWAVGGADAYDWSVIRDPNGRILDRRERVSGVSINWTYRYDPVGRLLEVSKDGALVEQYTYDLKGNRLTEINSLRGIIGRSYEHTVEDHVITAGLDSYVFDVDGFLQSRTSPDGTTSYQYSSRGELMWVSKPDGTLLSYVHDPLGRRIAKQVNGTTVEKYLWRDQTTLLAVYNGSDNLLQRFVYTDGRMPVSMTADGSNYFLLTDQVGTLRAVADTSGAIVKRIDYDSFGNITADSNPSFAVPFGFAGGLHDRDTGLVRFGARDYDPAIGRFTAKDPIDFAGGDTNLYGYVMNDPVNTTDPEGLSPEVGSCMAKCAADQFGVTTLLGATGVGLGLPLLEAGGKFSGATQGTSIASSGLAKLLPQRLTTRIWAPTISSLTASTPVLGRALGRWVPIVGWGLLAYDAASIGVCVNQCMNGEGQCGK